ncbi:hypothetical protein OOZ51_00340 [Arthrobacter sp. MI7-26]|uniref:hypothetical protein n=1 Tax=Arthrobacter sp. MI7-26 TaxID=2993653 RepID=UPI0022490764|nr:hypothetical protein [Arthrobacter sp. MI7-26]MCX2746261.1 hypothetical protein [Arthrobacter sp. MI7-26]
MKQTKKPKNSQPAAAQEKAKKARTRSSAEQQETTPVLAWDGVDHVSRKRWWWYLGFSLVVLWLAGVVIVLQQWLVLVVLITSAVALVIVSLGRTSTFACTLDGATLTMADTAYDLQDFKTFTLHDQDGSRDASSPQMIVLVPGKYLAIPKSVPLSSDDELNEEIVRQVESQLPYQDDPLTRTLTRMAAWFRL